jgi:hypothetical protein
MRASRAAAQNSIISTNDTTGSSLEDAAYQARTHFGCELFLLSESSKEG